MENKTSHPLLCDLESGVCEMPSTNSAVHSELSIGKKPVRIIYFTDPICSSCWGIEPQLRKLKLEYKNSIEIEYRMGGLLPDWSYNSGGISKPSDVAHHWDEVSIKYDMPIDGDVWLEDPLHSSYPPSIAFKAAAMQDTHQAILFLRKLRELVFLQKKNITQWEYIRQAAQQTSLDVTQLKKDVEGKAKDLFLEDLELAKQLGVRGFPTLFFVDGAGNQEKVYGTKPYEVYRDAILKLHPSAMKQSFEKDWKSLFATYPTLTAKEYSVLAGIPRSEVEAYLHQLPLEKLTTKNGALWITGQKKDCF